MWIRRKHSASGKVLGISDPVHCSYGRSRLAAYDRGQHVHCKWMERYPWKQARSRTACRYALDCGVQSPMLIIYPLYNAGFITLTGTAQLAFVLISPAIKFIVKRILKRVAGHSSAGITLAMTSADLFKALYLCKCMQSAGSMTSGLVLIAVDVVQNAFHLRDLHTKVLELEKYSSRLALQLDHRDVVGSFIRISQSSMLNHVAVRNTIHPRSGVTPTPAAAVLSGEMPNAPTPIEFERKVEGIFLRVPGAPFGRIHREHCTGILRHVLGHAVPLAKCQVLPRDATHDC